MKKQTTMWSLLGVTAAIFFLCASARASDWWVMGRNFYDDFSDGDPADGSPVKWLRWWGGDASGYVWTPEGLEVASAGAAGPNGEYYIYRDVSITVQTKRVSDHTNGEWLSGLWCRTLGEGIGGYWIEVRPPNRFWFGHNNLYVLRSASLPFNVDEEELMIRVDAVGNQLKAWCWPAGEPMPEKPQISFVDDTARMGTVGVYALTRGGTAIYRSVKVVSLEEPIVDFNGNGTVDTRDLLHMIQCWGQDEPSADLNGDGTVEANDLEILMEHWGQNVEDSSLLAHWALDETEGMIAYDGAGTNDGVLAGDPVWQPAEGRLAGALQLDGAGDCIIIDSFLRPDEGPFSPAEGPFSALAWVKGGAPGQVLLSQSGGANWLRVDPLTGGLMTELNVSAHLAAPLLSQASITDGDWHRIGFVWDGSYRTLYVDDVAVAQDAQDDLAGSGNGLRIGTGNTMAQGTYFSGLIDDIRIYKRAVSP